MNANISEREKQIIRMAIHQDPYDPCGCPTCKAKRRVAYHSAHLYLNSPIPEIPEQKKETEMKTLFIVANLQTAHWKMSDAKQFATKKEATDYAIELAGRWPSKTYHVFEAVQCVRREDPPVTVTELRQVDIQFTFGPESKSK